MSSVLAMDTKRVAVHTIDENLTDTVQYADYFYGSLANETERLLSSYPSELDYIKTRAGPVSITKWSARYANDSVLINVTGIYPDFVAEENGKYRIDFAGFIDRLCIDYPFSSLGRIDQEFDFTIIIPEILKIISVPKNSSEDMHAIYYNLTFSVDGNTVSKRLELTLKNDTDILTYCNERKGLDLMLKQGIVAETPGLESGLTVVWVLSILILLVLSMAYLVKR